MKTHFIFLNKALDGSADFFLRSSFTSLIRMASTFICILFIFLTITAEAKLTSLGETSAVSKEQRVLKVGLDAGHGGSDKGAFRSGISESKIVLELTEKLREQLKSSPFIEVYSTRDQDSNLSLVERRSKVDRQRVDVLMSIHANSSPDVRVTGMEVYFQNPLAFDEISMLVANEETRSLQLKENDFSNNEPLFDTDVKSMMFDLKKSHNLWKSQELARLVRNEWAPSGESKRNRRSVRQAPFFLVSQVNVPAVLVEIGFVSNPNELKKLVDQDYQTKMAESLASALIKFKENIDKPTL